MSKNKVIFIIAHKYFKGRESYLDLYINNINKFYGTPFLGREASGYDTLIIIVDNNSDDFDTSLYRLHKNVIFLENNIESKYEIGAYTVGIDYILKNNLLSIYDYFVFTQDNFIIKNKYDFNILCENNIKACTIVSYHQDKEHEDIRTEMLNSINLNNNIDKITFCWGNCFICHKEQIENLYNYIKKIIVKTKSDSQATERIMARVLWSLNDHRNFDIDGDMLLLPYDCHKVNLYDDVGTYFCKRVQHSFYM